MEKYTWYESFVYLVSESWLKFSHMQFRGSWSRKLLQGCCVGDLCNGGAASPPPPACGSGIIVYQLLEERPRVRNGTACLRPFREADVVAVDGVWVARRFGATPVRPV